jgi:hypothetical protein
MNAMRKRMFLLRFALRSHSAAEIIATIEKLSPHNVP